MTAITFPRAQHAVALIAAGLIFAPVATLAQVPGPNGTGSITRPNNMTSYGTGSVTKLLASNTTGNATPVTITINNTTPGNGDLLIDARVATTDTGASGAAVKVSLFSATPTLTGLADGSTYAGPYKADLPSFIGYLTCSTFSPTTDGTPGYYAQCSGSNILAQPLRFQGGPGSSTTLYGTIEVTTGFTPIANSVWSVNLFSIY
jgi:hypothetical protein